MFLYIFFNPLMKKQTKCAGISKNFPYTHTHTSSLFYLPCFVLEVFVPTPIHPGIASQEPAILKYLKMNQTIGLWRPLLLSSSPWSWTEVVMSQPGLSDNGDSSEEEDTSGEEEPYVAS